MTTSRVPEPDLAPCPGPTRQLLERSSCPLLAPFLAQGCSIGSVVAIGPDLTHGVGAIALQGRCRQRQCPRAGPDRRRWAGDLPRTSRAGSGSMRRRAGRRRPARGLRRHARSRAAAARRGARLSRGRRPRARARRGSLALAARSVRSRPRRDRRRAPRRPRRAVLPRQRCASGGPTGSTPIRAGSSRWPTSGATAGSRISSSNMPSCGSMACGTASPWRCPAGRAGTFTASRTRSTPASRYRASASQGFATADLGLWECDEPPIDVDFSGYFQEIPPCWRPHRPLLRSLLRSRSRSRAARRLAAAA